MSGPAPKWSVERLAAQLQAIGIERGERLFVHTGLRAINLTRDEAPSLLEAYQAVLGPEGTLFFPTYTYSVKGIRSRVAFSPAAPCHPMIGAWPEFARKAPGVVRSRHPTHSVAGIGQEVESILEGHEHVDAVGFGSPLDKLQQRNGKVLMVGCGFESCTFLHLAEAYAKVPYLGLTHFGIQPVGVVRKGREIREVPLGVVPRCSRGFPKMEPKMRAGGVLRDGELGEAHAMLCSMRPLMDAAVQAFREDPLGYLCERECLFCHHARSSCSSPLAGL